MRASEWKIWLVALVVLLALGGGAEAKKKKKGGVDGAAKTEEEKKGPKPYEEVITDKMVTDDGLFAVHRDGDDIYFEIPVEQLGMDMLWVTTMAETQAGFSWAGMPVGDRVVRWEKRDDRILLRDVNYDIRTTIDDPIQIAVEATSVAPIIHVFPVEAYSETEAPVIKVSPLFTTDKPEFSARHDLNAKALDEKRTFVEQVKSFPENIETRVLATYSLERSPPGQQPSPRPFPGEVRRDPSQGAVTVVLHHSMVKLPENPMEPRIYDDRVGFFSVGFTDYGDDSEHEAKRVRYVTRFRLEKKDPSAEVSEPVKPIIWYVSREVPEKWQQHVIDGIEQWQPAFEAAGFRNAIIGKLAPTREEDPDWDPEDARYTTIRWLPSAVLNAFGPHVHDPRTGEILEADVRMFHNVIKLVRDWYFVQASPSDPRAQKLPMPDDLVGELIAFVVAHEVGHSLGFPHNMKASSSYSIEQLRDPEFTRNNGTAPSIMDYARFNYVAQPGDGAALLPAVGPYDYFAVDWGYRRFPEGTDQEAELERIVAKQVDEPMYRFGFRNPLEDPTQQTEDLGANAVEATRMGLKNIERVAGYLVSATSEPGKNYEILENMHGVLLGQWRREMVHVANVVGGVERINLYYGDADRRYFPVDPGKQREAVAFLNDHAFRTPTMFLEEDIIGRIEASGAADRVAAAQNAVLGALINAGRIKRMSELVAENRGGAYPPAEMLSDVTAGIWSEIAEASPAIDLYRRNLQRAHVERLTAALESADSTSDLPALARGELIDLLEQVQGGMEGADVTTARHLNDIAARIRLSLDRVKVEGWVSTAAGGRSAIEPF
jgi:Met-zincin/Domain of unknown function (DUF5117)/Domain of unknown function (DUF5118)